MNVESAFVQILLQISNRIFKTRDPVPDPVFKARHPAPDSVFKARDLIPDSVFKARDSAPDPVFKVHDLIPDSVFKARDPAPDPVIKNTQGTEDRNNRHTSTPLEDPHFAGELPEFASLIEVTDSDGRGFVIHLHAKEGSNIHCVSQESVRGKIIAR